MAAYGFKPHRHLSGGVIRAQEYLISAAYTTKIHTGAPVKIVSGYINLAAAGDTMVGIFGGVSYVNSAGETKFSRYWTGEASATNIKAFVYDDPDILFSCYDDGVSDTTGDHVAGTASDITGVSGAMLDTSTVGTDAGFRLIGLVPAPGAAFGTANGTQAEVIVLINEHLYAR
jgi:hypothetical protein